MTERKQRLSAADSTKLLRKALKAAHPDTRFSVRMSRGTAYGNVSITWTDGPSTDDVMRVAAPFSGEGFDGMTDSSYPIETSIGDGYRSGIRLILPRREFSDAAMAEAIAKLEAAGWREQFDYSLQGAARSVLNGMPELVAADHHHLVRADA